MNISKLLLTAATLTVLGTPAFAQQSSLNQLQDGNQSLESTNTGTISFGAASGPVQGTNLNQTGGNQFNAIGPTTLLGVTGGATVNQGAGYYATGTGSAGGTLSLSSSNSNTANSTSTLFGSLSVLGSQSGANVLNQANLQGLSAGANDFTINQAANTGTTSTPATISSTNVMTGTASAGAVTVGNGAQTASGTVNTGSFLGVAGTANTVNLLQKAGELTLTNTNVATGNVTGNTQPSIDPAIVNLGQTSTTRLNTFSLGAGAPTLNGSQEQGTGTAAVINFGNTAEAFTGSSRTTAASFGVGATTISSTTQAATVGINSVSSTGDLALAAANGTSSFTQKITDVTLSAPTGNNTTGVGANGVGVVNSMFANTGTGAATISGTLSTVNGQTTTSSGQSFAISGNSLSGGALSGSLDQSAITLTAPTRTGAGVVGPATGYVNLAQANTTGGAASISNLAQSGSQTYNTVSATSANGLVLSQNAAGAIGGGNIQLASANGNASILGASQTSSLGANVVTLGSASGANLTQTAGALTLNNANVLSTARTTAGNNATITGTQSSVNTVNAIGR